MMSPREVQVIVHCTFECLRCHACAIIDSFSDTPTLAPDLCVHAFPKSDRIDTCELMDG